MFTAIYYDRNYFKIKERALLAESLNAAKREASMHDTLYTRTIEILDDKDKVLLERRINRKNVKIWNEVT